MIFKQPPDDGADRPILGVGALLEEVVDSFARANSDDDSAASSHRTASRGALRNSLESLEWLDSRAAGPGGINSTGVELEGH